MLKTMVVIGTLLAMSFYFINGTKKGIDEIVTIEHDGRIRQSIVHLPPMIQDDKLPVVLVFHGLFGNSNYTKNTYGMTEVGDREGFITVYPEGTGTLNSVLLSWNSGFCCGYAMENDVDDVSYIAELLGRLESVYPIDEKRVYLIGLSNGGMLVYRLMSSYPDLFAACAIVSSSPAGGASEDNVVMIEPPDTAIPLIVFHGMEDPIIPFDGGFSSSSEANGIYFPSIEESVKLWAEKMGAVNMSEKSLENGLVLLREYTGEDERSLVHFYAITDGDHTWPGREKGIDALSSSSQANIKASELIWEFMKDKHLD
ncbi:alpha/beta hydrolase family esterase [Mesotoga prima]|uniref:extracellular catalytic domain type 1 short-chain-length polyhydroxyalkanoate depolymerase n=1 Tax=Mesotoga prima TaxID=1184387 RepID=UPI002FE2F8B1